MNLKVLINKSWYGTIGYIAKKQDLEILEQYILFNLGILKEFQNIIIATNYGSDLQQQNSNIWKKYFPKSIIIDNKINRGHNHGYADLDNLIFNYCKKNNIKWLCKSANDMVFEKQILDKEIGEADFYYMNGIGVGGLVKYNFDFNRIINEDFYPQVNFYFINIDKIDYINDKDYLDKTFKQIINTPNYNGKIWEYIPGWSCEDFLKQCIQRNNLSKEHLIPLKKYNILLNLIKEYNIHDPSHKNIMIEGICHFSYPKQQIIKI
jgi:hypothetical protein